MSCTKSLSVFRKVGIDGIPSEILYWVGWYREFDSIRYIAITGLSIELAISLQLYVATISINKHYMASFLQFIYTI